MPLHLLAHIKHWQTFWKKCFLNCFNRWVWQLSAKCLKVSPHWLIQETARGEAALQLIVKTLMSHISAGFMTTHERKLYESLHSDFNKYWMPLTWFSNLASRAREEGRVRDDIALRLLMDVSESVDKIWEWQQWTDHFLAGHQTDFTFCITPFSNIYLCFNKCRSWIITGQSAASCFTMTGSAFLWSTLR